MDDLSRVTVTVISQIVNEAILASFIGLFIFIITQTVVLRSVPGL